MQIDRAAIFRFGKLADRTVDFAPGINIVYGKNEAGKTTLHAFLTAMLFGLEKGRGRAKGTEGYLRYEPWHAPSYYSGALQFSVGGRPFYLERNFYHKEPRARLCNLADGEELSVAYGDLGMLLGGVTREAYENTCDIPQCRAVTGAELTGLLAEYLSDMSDGGNAGIRVTRAVEKLEQKKRSLQSQIKSEQEKREQQLQQLTVERRMLEEDCGRLREQIEKAAADMRAYARMHPQVRDGQRPEDARTAENAGTASDRERRADGNGFPVRSLFLGLAAAVGLAGNAWWYYCAIGARGRRVQEKMGRRRRRRQRARQRRTRCASGLRSRKSRADACLQGWRKHSRRRKRDDAIWRNSWKYAAERAHGRENSSWNLMPSRWQKMRSSACQGNTGTSGEMRSTVWYPDMSLRLQRENTIWRKWTKRESSACRRREERFCRRRSAEERWNSSILRSAWQSGAL